MPLAPGSTIGHYVIVSPIGEGGMGVVYRATDTRLKRDVAIKVLPDSFSSDPARLARFTREAQLLASLNHPNIATIHGIEDRAIIMELVEGPTLAGRLQSGALPIDDAVVIGRQIGEALEAAHERGVVHRDLKPANVKITPEGVVKLLDFGLAKAVETSRQAVPSDPANTPTLTITAGSMAGVIMGTPGYMAPEQARGDAVDKRADIWAFGVVLHEMLTGRALFSTESIAQSIADILRAEIDLSALPPGTPRRVVRLLRRCLDRNVRTRLRDIGEVRMLLDEPEEEIAAAVPAPAPVGRRTALWPIGIAAMCAIGIPAAWFLKPTPEQPLLQVEIVPPLGVSMGPATWGQVAVSPDGTMIVFTGRDRTGIARLYLRRLAEGTTLPVAGSEGARNPFWSPDSAQIGFTADGSVKRAELASGRVVVIGSAEAGMGAWGADDVIVYSANRKFFATGAPAGKPFPERVPLPPGSGSPNMLPDGRTFLYSQMANPPRVLLSTTAGTRLETVPDILGPATFAPNPKGGGWLLYPRGELMAKPFDVRSGRFTGAEQRVVDEVPSGPSWSTSNNGVLAFRARDGGDRVLTWLQRSGAPDAAITEPGNVFNPRISPDQNSVAYAKAGEGLYRYEMPSSARTKIAGDGSYAAWAPKGGAIYFQFRDREQGRSALVALSSNGVRRTISSEAQTNPSSVSADGKWLAAVHGVAGMYHARLISIETGKTIPIIPPSDTVSHHPEFSPDGRRLAYSAWVYGRWEVFVRMVPGEAGGPADSSGQWQISTSGGSQPKWRADGRELFYIAAGGRLMAVPVDATASGFRTGAPVALFQTVLGQNYQYSREYDVTADGKRFILPMPPAGPHQESPITVIINWPKLLERN